MLVCMTRDCAKLLRKADIGDKKFNDAIREICAGNAVSLGHKIFKKRVGSRFGGKRGGYRSILYYRVQHVIVFMFIYAKNEQEDITEQEKKAFGELAGIFDQMDNAALMKAITENRLVRWNYVE
jgi:hypothetical protein